MTLLCTFIKLTCILNIINVACLSLNYLVSLLYKIPDTNLQNILYLSVY